jgi:hypothetical protein
MKNRSLSSLLFSKKKTVTVPELKISVPYSIMANLCCVNMRPAGSTFNMGGHGRFIKNWNLSSLRFSKEKTVTVHCTRAKI